jgi:hypothetical protein
MCADKPVVVLLDALDECPVNENAREDVLAWIEDVCKDISTQLLVTSRHGHDIETAFEKSARHNANIEIAKDLINNDIQAFVHSRVYDPNGSLGRWRFRPKVQRQIEMDLNEKSEGM